jgi:hypothetical protein
MHSAACEAVESVAEMVTRSQGFAIMVATLQNQIATEAFISLLLLRKSRFYKIKLCHGEHGAKGSDGRIGNSSYQELKPQVAL